MPQHLHQISLLVADYDEAIAYYTSVLNFELLEDTPLTPEKRWVVVCPVGGQRGCHLLLAKAANEEQQKTEEPYGKVAVFKDLYGNLWDLIQPTPIRT